MGLLKFLFGEEDCYYHQTLKNSNMTKDELLEAKKLNQEWLKESKKYKLDNCTKQHKESINIIDQLLGDKESTQDKKESGWKFW
jgi:uncharacterized protein YnzC (UPF0291/DUF896 family)